MALSVSCPTFPAWTAGEEVLLAGLPQVPANCAGCLAGQLREVVVWLLPALIDSGHVRRRQQREIFIGDALAEGCL